MADEKSNAELMTLVADVGEHLRYFRELGGGSLEMNDASIAPSASATSTKSPASAAATSAEAARTSRPIGAAGVAPPPPQPTTSAPSALERNARVAVPKLPPIKRKSYTPVVPALARNSSPSDAPPPSTADQPAPPTLPATDRTEMPKKTNQAAAPGATPAPQETLFGVITPKDEESLPRANETLADIRADVGDCTRCPLYAGRTHIVHSEGDDRARLMFVGEAPGADEDAQARPFVGRAGQLLNKIIEAIGMKREDVFIGNVNRCRPPQNRTPTPAEAATCKPFLLREIAIVQPAVIVVLGNTAMKNLLDTKEGITKVRGQFQDYRGIKVMPTFHPAYLLRDPSKKRETWEDMKKVRDYIDQLKSA